MVVVYGANGQVVPLGDRIGRGGEGTVYRLSASSYQAAKVFHQPMSPQRVQKVTALIGVTDESVRKLAAFPQSLLYNGERLPVGILMPLLEGYHDIHHLYGPSSRRQAFPSADWRFLVRAGTNMARAFSAVHAIGAVVGDVNHGSVLVSPQATVQLIDTDSFQLRHNGQLLHCRVGVPMFTPPELQGRDLSRTERTTQHDDFGLAVLLFQLLMQGRHPYAGVQLDQRDLSLEESIKQGRFAYGDQAHRLGVKPPPSALPLASLSPPVAQLFENAFGRSGTRPSSTQWISALATLERSLVNCGVNRSHHFASSLQSCPWCSFESASGLQLFGDVAPPRVAASWSSSPDVWQPLVNVQTIHPPPMPVAQAALPAAAPTSSASTVWVLFWCLIGATVPALVVDPTLAAVPFAGAVVCLLLATTKSGRRFQLRRAYASAKKGLEKAESLSRSFSHDNVYAKAIRDLQGLKDAVDALPAERDAKLRALRTNEERTQRDNHLKSTLIMRASISGIGSSRTSALASYGIESAYDITRHRVMAVPGIGPKTADNLLAWRDSVERRFVFRPNAPLDPTAVARIDAELAKERTRIMGEAQRAAGALPQKRQLAEAEAAEVAMRMQEAAMELQQAEAALNALGMRP
ncbi:Putative chaperonin [Euzebya pacifica]|uniref:Chaperonin n=1 Tax=Euzebya pacifica TaxID=1608957 RepID=A0A346XRY8_9ACTN|nr:Putative chaperonin [Euzebya pacifica]